jgi:hypothetical protein
VVRGRLSDVYPPESATESPSARGVPCQGLRPRRRSEMLRADLLKPDLLTKAVLLGTGAVLFGSLLLIVMTVLTRA